jgi:hypothetical protein
LAQVTSFFLRPVVVAPTAFIFSAIFSQTRGTPKKTVGRHALSVSPSVPLSASGRAKCTVALAANCRRNADRQVNVDHLRGDVRERQVRDDVLRRRCQSPAA